MGFTPEDRRKAATRAAKTRELRLDATALVDSFNLALSVERRKKVIAAVENMPPTHRRQYLKGVKGNQTAALRSFCCECVGHDRGEVTACTATACPLYSVRPYQDGRDMTRSGIAAEPALPHVDSVALR